MISLRLHGVSQLRSLQKTTKSLGWQVQFSMPVLRSLNYRLQVQQRKCR